MENYSGDLYFPNGCLSTRADLHRLQADYFAPFLQGMGEHPFCPATQGPLKIRLLSLPTWSSPCCIRIETNGEHWRLFGKEMDGEAGFEVGRLTRVFDRILVAHEIDQIAILWKHLQFWSLPAECELEVIDGTFNVLEASEQGRYHVIERDEWEWGDTFGELHELLFKLANLALR